MRRDSGADGGGPLRLASLGTSPVSTGEDEYRLFRNRSKSPYARNCFAGRGVTRTEVGKPMSEKQQNLQDTFLNAVRKSKSSVTIFLVNGVKLQGNITWFDNFCVLLRRDGQAQLVYKHAISTVMPLGPIQLMDAETVVETA